jgi:hypothetical protein
MNTAPPNHRGSLDFCDGMDPKERLKESFHFCVMQLSRIGMRTLLHDSYRQGMYSAGLTFKWAHQTVEGGGDPDECLPQRIAVVTDCLQIASQSHRHGDRLRSSSCSARIRTTPRWVLTPVT